MEEAGATLNITTCFGAFKVSQTLLIRLVSWRSIALYFMITSSVQLSENVSVSLFRNFQRGSKVTVMFEGNVIDCLEEWPEKSSKSL